MASSGDVSSEGEQQQAYDEEIIAKAQEEGARELFEKIGERRASMCLLHLSTGDFYPSHDTASRTRRERRRAN